MISRPTRSSSPKIGLQYLTSNPRAQVPRLGRDAMRIRTSGMASAPSRRLFVMSRPQCPRTLDLLRQPAGSAPSSWSIARSHQTSHAEVYVGGIRTPFGPWTGHTGTSVSIIEPLSRSCHDPSTTTECWGDRYFAGLLNCPGNIRSIHSYPSL